MPQLRVGCAAELLYRHFRGVGQRALVDDRVGAGADLVREVFRGGLEILVGEPCRETAEGSQDVLVFHVG